MKVRSSVGSRASIRRIAVLAALVLIGGLLIARAAITGSPRQASSPGATADLLEGYRHVEVASVSDAMEQLTGRRMYMTHRMHPIFPTKFAGYAVTVLLKKEANNDPNALNGMLAAIDQGSKDSVYVMVVEDGADIAGMGGLMGTAMYSREYAGAVIDGGVRDVVRWLQYLGHLRRRSGQSGRYHRGRSGWSGGRSKGRCREGPRTRAGNGLQGTLHVSLYRKAKVYPGGSEEVRPALVPDSACCRNALDLT